MAHIHLGNDTVNGPPVVILLPTDSAALVRPCRRATRAARAHGRFYADGSSHPCKPAQCPGCARHSPPAAPLPTHAAAPLQADGGLPMLDPPVNGTYRAE